MKKISINNLIQTSEGDLVMPIDKINGKAALFNIVNSNVYAIVELEPNPSNYNIENNLKHGENWEEKASFFQSEQEARKKFEKLRGKEAPEDVTERYKDRL